MNILMPIVTYGHEANTTKNRVRVNFFSFVTPCDLRFIRTLADLDRPIVAQCHLRLSAPHPQWCRRPPRLRRAFPAAPPRPSVATPEAQPAPHPVPTRPPSPAFPSTRRSCALCAPYHELHICCPYQYEFFVSNCNSLAYHLNSLYGTTAAHFA